VLCHELKIATLQASVHLVFDSKVRQLQVTVDYRKAVRVGKEPHILASVFVSSRTIRSVQERLIVTLEFMVEHHATDPVAFVLDSRS